MLVKVVILGFFFFLACGFTWPGMSAGEKTTVAGESFMDQHDNHFQGWYNQTLGHQVGGTFTSATLSDPNRGHFHTKCLRVVLLLDLTIFHVVFTYLPYLAPQKQGFWEESYISRSTASPT